MGPVLGALIAAGIQGLFGLGATAMANRYNSPRSQKRRLREAGLPLAFMYSGRVNQQSDVPKLSIDPDLGTVEQQQLEYQGRLTDKQVEKLVEEIRGIGAESDIKVGEAAWQTKLSDVEGQEGRTNQEVRLDVENAIKVSENFIKGHEQVIKEIEKWAEEALFAKGVQVEEREQALAKVGQQITNLLKQAGLMDQLKEIRSVEAVVSKTIGEFLEQGDPLVVGIYAALIKLFSKL